MKLVSPSTLAVIATCLLISLVAGCSTTVSTRSTPRQHNPCGTEVSMCRSNSASRIVRAKKPFAQCGCGAIGEIVY